MLLLKLLPQGFLLWFQMKEDAKILLRDREAASWPGPEILRIFFQDVLNCMEIQPNTGN